MSAMPLGSVFWDLQRGKYSGSSTKRQYSRPDLRSADALQILMPPPQLDEHSEQRQLLREVTLCLVGALTCSAQLFGDALAGKAGAIELSVPSNKQIQLNLSLAPYMVLGVVRFHQ